MKPIATAVVLLSSCATLGNHNPDVSDIQNPRFWRVVNGETAATQEQGRSVLRLAPRGGNQKGSNVALALERGLELSTGTIDVDLKGNGDAEASFVGVAFNVSDAEHFEAIYFRPFRFRATDAGERAHAVQYVAWPGHTWEALRQASPGHYEGALQPAPDPAGWFHARIEVLATRVKVYVDGAATPCLDVERLEPAQRTKAALFVDSQPGFFANLSIHES